MPTPPSPMLPRGLYGIADAGFGDPVEIGAALTRGGCRVIQLRAKGWEPARLLEAARALRQVTRAAGSLLLVNDDVEVALLASADGVHLGQEDGELEGARARLGPHRLIGRSTHDVAQARAASVADYIGFGPVFPTHTKVGAAPVVGLQALAELALGSPIPVVAIGGITRRNLQEVVQSGAHGWAIISDLLAGPDPETQTRHLMEIGASMGRATRSPG